MTNYSHEKYSSMDDKNFIPRSISTMPLTSFIQRIVPFHCVCPNSIFFWRISSTWGTCLLLVVRFTFIHVFYFIHFSQISFVGPWCGDRDYRIGSNFWKFYLIRTGFTLGEPVSLVKKTCSDCLDRNWIFFGVQSVDTVSRCTTSNLLAGPACLWCLVGLALLQRQR
jgi:hypothetical protein